MKSGQFLSGSQEETEDFGRRLGESLTLPSVVFLQGSLGAGKTAMTRGIVKGLGCRDSAAVHSPTFSLINEYSSPAGRVYHVDLYRLDTLQDLYSIGLDELLIEEAFIIIEWAEKLLISVEPTWRIIINVTGQDGREIQIQGRGS